MPPKHDALREQLTAEPPPEHLPWDRGLSSGSTQIDLAATGRVGVSAFPGDFVLWVGDSGSGKTYVTLSTLAEASINPAYKDYRLLFHNAEDGARMDLRRHFGGAFVDRLEPLMGTRRKPDHCTVLEDVYDALDDAFEKGPCVALVDSMDALVPRAWVKKHAKDRRARGKKDAEGEEGEQIKGSYGTDKAKVNSERLRVTVAEKLRKHGSIFSLISQTRDKIGPGAMFDPKTRGGGKAMSFYAHLELWTSVRGHRVTKVADKPVEQGVLCRVRIRKNRLTGRPRTVDVPILHGLGIDDMGGMIDWLCEWRHWDGTEKTVVAPEFGFKGTKERLIARLQEQGRDDELKAVVQRRWDEIEEQVTLKRRPRYA